jgi:hypothetical protein
MDLKKSLGEVREENLREEKGTNRKGRVIIRDGRTKQTKK